MTLQQTEYAHLTLPWLICFSGFINQVLSITAGLPYRLVAYLYYTGWTLVPYARPNLNIGIGN